MIWKIFKIAIALLVVNGTLRAGSAYWTDYRFEDRLTQIAQFGDRRKDPELCTEAVEAAAALGVPVTPESILIRRGNNPTFSCGKGYEAVRPAGAPSGAHKLFIEASYGRDVALAPGYSRRFDFHPSVEVWARVY